MFISLQYLLCRYNKMKKTIILVFAILMTASGAFAAYDKALALYQEKKYKESLTILAEDLVVADDFKQGSPNYKIRFLAAHNHWKMGNEQSASAHFRKCMAIEKSNVSPYIDLAILLTEKGKLSLASSVVEDGLKVKDDPMLYWILGRISYLKENYGRAKELLEKANSMDPELYFSYNDLGLVLIKLNKVGDANAAFSVAYAVNPGSLEIVVNLSTSFLLMGKTADAEVYLKKAQELAPDNEKVKNLAKKIEEKKK